MVCSTATRSTWTPLTSRVHSCSVRITIRWWAGPASLFAKDSAHPDNIIFDIELNPNGGTGASASGFGHPTCLQTFGSNTLPAVR